MLKDSPAPASNLEFQPKPDRIRSELQRLLKSDWFKNSKRCKTLLSYTVEETLAGRGDQIKERLLGVNVFGRSPEYDTAEDPVVRNAAIEVRKRLAQCYLESGNDAEVRIELHAGTYVPEFHISNPSPEPPPSSPTREEAQAAGEEPAAAVESQPEPSRKKSFHWIALGIGLAVLIGAGLTYYLAAGATSNFDRFWSPMFALHEPVQIVVGQPSGTFHFIGPRYPELRALFLERKGNPDGTAPIRADDIRWDADRYIYIGDAFAMAKLSTLVQMKGSKFRLRPDTSTDYSELRGSPVIAIGAFNNSWARRLGDGTRFSLGKKVVDGVEYTRVVDLNEPNARKWMIPDTWMIPHSPPPSEDYAVVTRVVDPSTERTVVLVAGIYDAGTRAASEFVTEPAYMNAALQSAPRGWERSNLQLVLRTKMIAGTPGPAKVVAMHFW